MACEVRTRTELQVACLMALKQCHGFERVQEILVEPRERGEGFTNWTLAAVRPRVGNDVLRRARDTIAALQRAYRLPAAEAARPPRRKQHR
jgi:hypothetical protein